MAELTDLHPDLQDPSPELTPVTALVLYACEVVEANRPEDIARQLVDSHHEAALFDAPIPTDELLAFTRCASEWQGGRRPRGGMVSSLLGKPRPEPAGEKEFVAAAESVVARWTRPGVE